MILEISHPELGPMVEVEIVNGAVTRLKALQKGEIPGDPVRAMRGWIEPSVREWSKANGWMVKKKKHLDQKSIEHFPDLGFQ